jgi:hypothetical protein
VAQFNLPFSMTLAIMQPYFFPYIGYFQLINAVDKFVVYDDVNFINKGWINRNNILVGGKANLFTVPLKGASQNLLIHEIELENIDGFSKKFLKTIEQSYKKAPFFNEGFEIVERVFNSFSGNISELATKSLTETCQYLGLDTEIVPSSVIYQNQNLKAQERILDICLQEKAAHYINPIGGLELYSKELFAQNGILLNFIKSKRVEYPQFKNEFVPWLSMIDVLMFCSKDQIYGFLSEYQLV